MKRLLFLFLLCPAAFLLLGASCPLQSPSLNSRVIRVICLPARPLAILVAQEQQFFAKYGIELHTEAAINSDILRTGLTEGKFDIAHAAVDNAVAMDEKDGSDMVIVMGGEGSTNELIAQPEIHSVSDLRGKTLIVDAPTTAYALQLKKILLLNNLHVGSDYQFKAIGGTPLRLVALREHKEYAASILGPPTSLIAKHEGFISLGMTRKFIGPYQAIGAFARHDWAGQNRDLLASYLAAFIEGQRWLLEPAHKQQVIALLVKESKLSEEIANETYNAWVVAPDGLQPDAHIDIVGLSNVLQLRADVEGTWNGKPPSPEKYYDDSYYLTALEKISEHK